MCVSCLVDGNRREQKYIFSDEYINSLIIHIWYKRGGNCAAFNRKFSVKNTHIQDNNTISIK